MSKLTVSIYAICARDEWLAAYVFVELSKRAVLQDSLEHFNDSCID